MTLIISRFSGSSWVLIHCSSRTPQIQRTTPLSADVKHGIALLDAGRVLQPYSKLFLIQVLKMLPQFLSEIPRLVMIGNSYLKPFHAAVMRALVASTQPPDSPITLPKYWKVGTASNVSSLTCTKMKFKLSVGALSPLHFLHLNILSFFSVLLWIQRLQFWQSIGFTPTPLKHTPQSHLWLNRGLYFPHWMILWNVFSPRKIEENMIFSHFAVMLSQQTIFQVSEKISVRYFFFVRTIHVLLFSVEFIQCH